MGRELLSGVGILGKHKRQGPGASEGQSRQPRRVFLSAMRSTKTIFGVPP